MRHPASPHLPTTLLLSAIVCLSLVMMPSLGAEGVLLTWKSTSGSSVQAELVRVEGETVLLQTADGKRIKLTKDQLDAASLAQLIAATGDYAVKETAPWMPVFVEGPASGHYARYRTRSYEALVTMHGHVRIFFLGDDGERVSDRYLLIRPSLGFTRKQEWLGRALTSTEANGPPALQAEKVVVGGGAADGVSWEFTYEFSDSKVAAWGMAKDPGNIEFPTICQVVTTLPRYRDLDYQRPVESVQGVVGKSNLVVEKKRGKDIHFNYFDRYELPKLANDHKNASTEATVQCNLFGDRTIRWEPSSLSYGRLLFHAEGTAALWDGYAIYFRNNDARSNSRKSRITLTFN